MKKSFRPQWLIVIITLLSAAAGAFVRSRQLSCELLSDGSLAEGSYRHFILIGITVLLIGSLIGLLLPVSKRECDEKVFSTRPLTCVICILCAAGLLIGNFLLFLEGPEETTQILSQSPAISAFLSKLLPPFGLFSAACIMTFAVLCMLRGKPSGASLMAACLYLALRLIVRFQIWNTDPSIHDYCFKLFASICAMIGTFCLAGFCLGIGKRRITLFWTLCGFVFGCISLADALADNAKSELIICASLTVFMAVNAAQLLFCKELPPEEPEEPEESAPLYCETKI